MKTVIQYQPWLDFYVLEVEAMEMVREAETEKVELISIYMRFVPGAGTVMDFGLGLGNFHRRMKMKWDCLLIYILNSNKELLNKRFDQKTKRILEIF